MLLFQLIVQSGSQSLNSLILGKIVFRRFNNLGRGRTLILLSNNSCFCFPLRLPIRIHRIFISNLGYLHRCRFQQFQVTSPLQLQTWQLYDDHRKLVATTYFDSLSPHRPKGLHRLGKSYLYRFNNNQEATDLEESTWISNVCLPFFSLKTTKYTYQWVTSIGFS